MRQAELHSDLKIQEKDELQWKKIKVEGLDENGEKEAQLRRNFNGETVSAQRCTLGWVAPCLLHPVGSPLMSLINHRNPSLS